MFRDMLEFDLTIFSGVFLIPIEAILSSYENQIINLPYKSIDWFLCECNIGMLWVNILDNKNEIIYFWVVNKLLN